MTADKKTVVAITAGGALALLVVMAGLIWLRSPREEGGAAPPTPKDLGLAEDFFPVGGAREEKGRHPQFGEEDGAAAEPERHFANLVKISNQPVAGAGIFSTTTNAVVFVEKTTGHLYQIISGEENPARLSNTTIPKITEAIFGGNNGQISIILRYFKDGRTQNFFAASRAPERAGGEFLTEGDLPALTGKFLNPNIYQIAASPDKNKIFHLSKQGGETVGAIADFDGGNPKIVFTSALNDWIASWPADSTVAVQTKPSSGLSGLVYFLKPQTGEVKKVLSGVPGLSTLVSPDGKKILQSSSVGAAISLGVYEVESDSFRLLPVRTLAEKCSFASDGETVYCGVPGRIPPNIILPDEWYSGEAFLTDNVWKINLVSRKAEILFNPELAGLTEPLDIGQLLLSPDGKTLYLVNKLDSGLWALNLAAGF